MKGSIVTSAIMHGAFLTWALVSISAPTSFEVADVEAMPVDIVPIEELTQIQQGDKTATAREKAAPVPTKRPDHVENAQNTGDNQIDLKSPPTPEKRPVNTEVAAAPKPAEKVLPTQSNETNDIKDVAKEETVTAPATEVAAKAEPPREVTPIAKPQPSPQEQQPKEETKAEEIPVPDSVPLPAAKPRPEPPKPVEQKVAEAKPAEAQTAKTPDRKVAEKKQETAKAQSSQQSEFNADEISALLNKQNAAGGGAKRSTEQAALGGKKTTSGNTLSQSEMDALRGQIQNNWSTFAGIEGLQGMIIRVSMQLDPSGAIVGEPVVSSSGGSETARRTMEASARRAVLRSAPFHGLPAEKYDSWSEVVVNFDPSSMGL